ncbi:hypothetical protein MYP_2766 [Sporocytophaga myxococcoides]|uniref:Uncharacterized protein n=1 Tax=Sporocytophaga myxococcoides TaxID=153721 RepID=A0A098LGH2_9BACT|nr:hypothetical protein [Sporocytophaga myxococcoides]GAL85537.1 hypothetical protein MYP_2766 [Sporocytophaga myxococcoides]
MRTSLNEIREIEEYLLKYSTPEFRLVFEARILLQPELQEKVNEQKQVYDLIRKYSRKQLKTEIETVHDKLFTASEHKTFRQRILNLFTNS